MDTIKFTLRLEPRSVEEFEYVLKISHNIKYWGDVNYYEDTWVTNDYFVETIHNLPNGISTTWVITAYEASQIQVHFASINMEQNWDYVYIYDVNDALVATYTGSLSNFWTPVALGDTLKIKVVTDSSTQSWGYKTDEVKFYDIGHDLEGATHYLLANAQRITAGFIKFFFDSVNAHVYNKDTKRFYSTIQGAINDAQTLNGHTIIVSSGTYYEHVVVNKSVSLLGESRETTIIDGGGSGIVVHLTADNVLISGFTLKRGELSNTTDQLGILNIESDHNLISGNMLKETRSTIIGMWNANHNTISQNFIANPPNLEFRRPMIQAWESQNNIIEDNILDNDGIFTSQQHGIFIGWGSHGNIIQRNTIRYMTGFGIHIKNATNNLIKDNSIVNSDSAIELSYLESNTVVDNTFANNNYGIRLAVNTDVYHNNFINNIEQAQVITGRVSNWDDGYPSGGNYWSDYSGVDVKSGADQDQHGSDGMGDIPYVIDEFNIDKYPLMNPWTGYKSVQVPIKGGENATITSNATVTKTLVTRNTLHFEASGSSGHTGWTNITFPMINTTEIKVFINGTTLMPPPLPAITTNWTHYFIYFEFTLSTDIVVVQFWLLGDITGPEGNSDYKVDIRDIATAALAFGSYPDNPIWNPIADFTGPMYLVPDNKIDIRDIALIAINFGKTYP